MIGLEWCDSLEQVDQYVHKDGKGKTTTYACGCKSIKRGNVYTWTFCDEHTITLNRNIEHGDNSD
jgi:hypothetical protein